MKKHQVASAVVAALLIACSLDAMAQSACDQDCLEQPGQFDPYSSSQSQAFSFDAYAGSSGKSCIDTLCAPYCDVYGNTRRLPFAASLALDRGYELPLPFGVQGAYNYLKSDPRITDVRVGFSGGPVSSIPATVSGLKNDTQTAIIRIDGWILPFFNLYGLFGETSVDSRGDLVIPNPVPTRPDIVVPIRVRPSGPTYGVGATLAVGYRDWFLALDSNITRTDLDLLDSDIDKKTVGIRTGLRGEGPRIKATGWIGGMYLDRHTHIAGTANTGTSLDPIKYEVDTVFDNPWMFLVGGVVDFSPSWNLTLEGGFGDIKQLTAAMSYRF